MIDAAPIYVPYVPNGRPTGSERLGLGQVSARPESARALNAPDESSAKSAFSERKAAIDSSQQQPMVTEQAVKASRSFVELGARARVAAGSDTSDEPEQSPRNSLTVGSQTAQSPTAQSQAFGNSSRGDQESVAASSVMRQRVEIAVRLALPSEETSRQFNILV